MQKPSLFGRQKLLLALLQLFGGRLPAVDFQKYLFLFTEKYQTDKSYEFVPHRFGCFSFQSRADKNFLARLGAIVIDENNTWQLVGEHDYIIMLPQKERDALYDFHARYKDMEGNELIKYVYREYPYYAIKSELAPELMSATEMAVIKQHTPKKGKSEFFTIGYEGASIDNYLSRLIKNNIKLLCDVRKNPLSRKYGFAKSTLAHYVKKFGIDYIHMPELGIVAEKRQHLATQQEFEQLFDDYERTTLKQNSEALDRLEQLLNEYQRVAITCFEADHVMCHRNRVAKAMKQLGKWKDDVKHIWAYIYHGQNLSDHI